MQTNTYYIFYREKGANIMQKIFYNGTIVTMEDMLCVPAVLINNRLIEKTGTLDELKAIAPNAQLVDLQNKTMLPAFIDAHSHFSAYANSQLQPSLNEVISFEEISEKIKAFISSNHIPAGKWVMANSYDHNTMKEKSHPTRQLLDSIAPENPLILQHKSGHCGVLNSKALALFGITADTVSPPGGLIERIGNELTGYLEEDAFIDYIKKVPMSDFSEMLGAYNKAQEKYLSYGITTVQEGMMIGQMIPLYEQLLLNNLLIVDAVAYPDIDSMQDIRHAFPNSWKSYNQHFKIGGYKIFLDGSPQVKTAWMQSPYKDSGDYCGYGTLRDEDVLHAVEKATKDDIQILAHCNGDAAVQQYIDAIEKVATNNPHITSLKPVIIHSQLITKQQLTKASELHMIPSFFVAHVFHWGDTHIENFGLDRAKMISPAKSALDNHVIFTFHQDTPVIEPNVLETIQCAAIRKTKNGISLGEDECITVLEALKAVTINAAYQYSEQDTKGSIKEGKQANFVILSDNPLTVSKDTIGDIVVLETIKDGQTVFSLDTAK